MSGFGGQKGFESGWTLQKYASYGHQSCTRCRINLHVLISDMGIFPDIDKLKVDYLS